MNYFQVEAIMKQNKKLVFKYKIQYYTIRKRGKVWNPKYQLIDSDNNLQQQDSLKKLYYQGILYDGKSIFESNDMIEIVRDTDEWYSSYEAIKHSVVVDNVEVLFSYKGKDYWIAHACEGFSHLSDSLGNTQKFNSKLELFENARIDNKSLKEIWDEVIVDTC